jgi:sigma-E factor negative regulatory protein RseC
MLVETGRVAKKERDRVVVEVEKNSACAECHVGCACDIDKSIRLVEANNPLGAEVDQYVQVSIPNDSVLRASFVVYIIPLSALIAGTLLGRYIGVRVGVKDLFEVLSGFTCLGLSFLFVRYYNNLFKQQLRNQPVITKIMR